MTVNRRFLLKGMAFGSLSGLTLNGLPALAARATETATASAPHTAILTVVNTITSKTPFLHAAQQAHTSTLPVLLLSTELDSIRAFDRRLRAGQPLHVVGLLDDATATLALDVARGAGAKVHWLGQHTTVAGITYHRILGTDHREHYAQQLSQQAGQWMEHLGALLISRSAPLAVSGLHSTAGTPVIGSFVSFSIEV